jgi:hypothetical protein
MSEQPTQKGLGNDKPPPPTRAQRLAGFGFLGAFGLTILTVLLTGLRVGAPAARHVLYPVPPAAESGPPSAERAAPSRTSRTAASVPAVPPPSVSEQPENDDAAREDSSRDPDDGTRKDSARDADEGTRKDSRRDKNDSRAHNAR